VNDNYIELRNRSTFGDIINTYFLFLKNNFIDKLAGTNKLQKQIKAGWTEDKIKATWQSGLDSYLIKRKPYLIYN